MSRKTINVEELKNQINEQLRTSTKDPSYRLGLISILESVLHTTRNYKGFGYLLEEHVPKGELPGINYEVTTSGMFQPCENYEERFFNTDSTRVHYY